MNRILTPDEMFSSPSFKKFAREVCELLIKDAEYKKMKREKAKQKKEANEPQD